MSIDDLPVAPPVAPMLATLARELPVGPTMRYEPKWDGFRCLAFRAGADVDLRSRHDRPLARYFPEVVAACVGSRPSGSSSTASCWSSAADATTSRR